MTQSKIRVRFAPSPTGALHMGGARTAIYNWLFARANDGDFLLRIEDTDVQRSKKELVDQILSSVKWLGMDWDEAPVFQSKRFNLYNKYIEQLLNSGNAYPCFCTKEELELERKNNQIYQYSGRCKNLSQDEILRNMKNNKPYSIRFKIPDGVTRWKDKVYKKIEVKNEEIDDFIIKRSDGNPTYQLAVVADDIEMKITHVIRGEDHISNTPKQIRLYLALGQTPPIFAHLPLLLGIDGKRLSKRHGATGVDEYKNLGYPSDAVFNYLTLLGWAPKSNKEILKINEIIEKFSLTEISKKSAVFDIKKMDWVSGQHLSIEKTEKIKKELIPLYKKKYLINDFDIAEKSDYLSSVIDLLKERAKNYNNFIEWGEYFFKSPTNYDEQTVKKYWNSTDVNIYMEKIVESFKKIDNWESKEIENVVRNSADNLNIKAAQVIHPLRIAVTGLGVSPDIFKIIQLIGKNSVIARLNKAIIELPYELFNKPER